MMGSMIIDEVVERLAAMPVNLQRQVLDYVEALRASTVRGVPGKTLTRFAGAIPMDDLSAMQAAIESDCERIDPDISG
jgi:hypothetical protein